MSWNIEKPENSGWDDMYDIEVGCLYKLSVWKPKYLKTKRLLPAAKSDDTETVTKIVIPLKRLTYNMSTGDTELQVLCDNEVQVLPGWMIGQNGGLLEKLN